MMLSIKAAVFNPSWVPELSLDLAFEAGGKIWPRFVRDAAGYVVECGSQGNPNAFIPYQKQCIASAHHIDPEFAALDGPACYIEHILSALDQARASSVCSEVETLYPGFSLPRYTALFSGRATANFACVSQEGFPVAKMINDARFEEAANKSSHGLSSASGQNNVMVLAQTGIYRTGDFSEYGPIDERYYVVAGNKEDFKQSDARVLFNGWYSEDKVYAKAILTSDPDLEFSPELMELAPIEGLDDPSNMPVIKVVH